MMTAFEPTLFFSVYVHRHLPGHREADPRALLLQQVDAFAQMDPRLTPVSGLAYEEAGKVDLVELDRAPSGYRLLFNLGDVQLPTSGPERQCLVYSFADSLVVQVMLTYSSGWRDAAGNPWTGSLSAGWNDLIARLRAGFDGARLEAARDRTFGASTVCWAIAREGIDPETFGAEAGRILGLVSPARVGTDIGPLWRGDVPVFPQAPSISQDAWVLVTPRSGNPVEDDRVDGEANRRYNQPERDHPPPFALVALARHKVEFEWRDYHEAKDGLERMGRSLDRRQDWVVETQRYHGETLGNLRRRESIEFQDKLARAHMNLADYRQAITRLRGLRDTIAINRGNFVTNCPELISGDEAKHIRNSANQKKAAEAFLAGLEEDGFFRSEAGRMKEQLQGQIEADLGYADQLVERSEDALRSGGVQLQIAAEREMGEISADRGIESSALVASLAALISVELLRVAGTLTGTPVLATNVILLAVTGSFAVSRILTMFRSPKTWTERGSFGMTVGAMAGTGAALLWGESSWAFIALNLGVFLAGTVLGALAFGWIEIRSQERRRRRRARRGSLATDVAKILYATEELPDLLEDLPPTEKFRVKRDASFREKLRKKNEERNRVGNTDPYDETDVGDVIGVRYIVAPWRIEEVVERVMAVTHPIKPPEYRNDRKQVGMMPEERGGRTVLVDDPEYRGRYRGFMSNYKGVHVDVDLWGVGARKDVNLMAEIQVRTPLQNIAADWFHDIVYKEKAPRPKGRRVPFGRLARAIRGASVPYADAIFNELLEPTFGIQRADVKKMEVGRHVEVQTGDGRRTIVPLEDCQDYIHTAPWLVRFFDLWHPRLNRPLARILIWLSDAELRLFRDSMGWDWRPTPY